MTRSLTVLSVKAMQPGDRGGYYLASLPDGPAAYYLAGGRAGVWLGSGTVRLGLEGPVEGAAFEKVLAGVHPAAGTPLVSGRAAAAGRVPGFDLTFSAPKSVTLLAVLSEPQVGDVVRAAHRRAVADTMGLVEAEVARARRGHDGIIQLPVELVAAGFEHHTSRAVDPQLHTHVVVANVGWATDDRWSALYGRRLYGWAKTAGTVYQAALRAHLTETLGVEWGPLNHGIAELAGFSRAQLDAFSTRRAEIRAELERVGQTSARAAQLAAWATRSAKTEVPEQVLAERWDHVARQVRIDAQLVTGLTGPPRPSGGEPPVDEVITGLLGPEGLTTHASSFDPRHVLQAVACAHHNGAEVDNLTVIAARLLADHRAAPLEAPSRLGDRRFSTVELLGIEQRLLERARRQASAGLAVATPDAVAAALAARPSLSGEQRRMVEQLTTSGAGVEVVVGRAGAGKTFALDAARAVWQHESRRVIGAALAARAATELQAGAGIPSTTLDRLLIDAETPGAGGGLPYWGVVVVDEAGMVGTRKLAHLLALAERSHTKCVLVGDMRQLPEVEAGGAFAALAGSVPTVELVDNRRQVEAWERQALAELRAGDVTTAVEAYAGRGRVTLAQDADSARQRLVDDWWAALTQGGDCAIYALRRSDVADLNARARRHMAAAGLLHGEPLSAAGREFAVGDEVLALRNDRRLGVRNGTRATVIAVNQDIGIRARTPTGAELVLPADYLDAGYLDHGYAMTIHKAQGATVDRAFLLGSDTLYREAGYVGLSRARTRTDLYLVATAGPERAGATELDPVARLAADLRRSQAQHLASSEPVVAAPAANLAELDRRRRELLRLIGPIPSPPVEQAQADLTAARMIAAQVESRLAKVGELPRRHRTAARSLAQADVASAALRRERAELAWQAEQEARREWRSWLDANTETLDHYRQLHEEITRRRQNIETAALVDPEPLLVDALGPPPVAGPARERWAEAAGAIATYREHWAITDAERPLGPEPTLPEQARQHRAVRLAVERTQQTLTRQLDTGLER